MTAPDQAESLQRLRQLLTSGRPAAGVDAEPPSLPPVNEDPSYLKAEALQRAHPGRLQEVRQDFSLVDLVKAERVARIWAEDCAELTRLGEDLQARRTARAEWIERQLPVGPGVAPDTSAADRAVLNAAWRTAWDRANATNPDGRIKLLAEATRFGDDILKRAVITACLDLSETMTVDRWAGASDPAAAALFTEWRNLRLLLTGQHFDNRWEPLVFRKPPKPDEVADLPRLQAARDAAQREAGRQQAMRLR